MTRTVLITEIIAPYRIPVFNALARESEIDLHVIFLSETDPTLRKWPIYADEISFSYEVLRSRRWRAGERNLLVNRGLRAALDAARPGTIVCGGYNYLASWQSLLWARGHNVRFVLWSESNQEDKRQGNPGVEWFKRYFVKSCSGFVVPGKSSWNYLRTLGASERSIFTAPDAVDNAFFVRQASEARAHAAAYKEARGLPERFILCATRFVPEKGIFDLLHAYAKLEDKLRSEVGLVFAGDGPAGAELIRQAERVRPGAISFPGFVQREELAILYAVAETFVLPTHSDPWGLVVNEAMACGLPVIVTSVAGCAPDLVENGWNGFVVPPNDPEKLREAMTTLAQNPELRQQMGARSFERIGNYSPELCAKGLAAAALLTEEAR